jgi:hypothetical protein
MYQLLSLPRDIETANHVIDAANAFPDPPDFEDFFEARRIHYAKLGLTAFALTEEIRMTYKLPPRKIGEWSSLESLKTDQQAVEEERRVRLERLKQSDLF